MHIKTANSFIPRESGEAECDDDVGGMSLVGQHYHVPGSGHLSRALLHRTGLWIVIALGLLKATSSSTSL